MPSPDPPPSVARARAITAVLVVAGLVATAGLVAAVVSLNDRDDDSAGTAGRVTPSTPGADVRLRLDDCPSTDADAPAVPGGLPDLTLSCLGAGDDVTLSGLAGKPMVINVWAQWCGPCETELPYLARADQAYGGRVAFLGIDFQETDEALALDLLGRSGVTYPQVADPDGDVRGPFQLGGLPMTVLVGADGEIVDVVAELESYAQLQDIIESELGVRAP